jgi:hypothetical protein
MQGLGVFGCCRAAWPASIRLGGSPLQPSFRAAIPVSREDRVRNYLLVHEELGLDPTAAIGHFEQEFGAERVRSSVEGVQQELQGPFDFFDAIYCAALSHRAIVAAAKWLG